MRSPRSAQFLTLGTPPIARQASEDASHTSTKMLRMEGKQREVMISLCVSLFPPLLSFILVSVLIRVANGAQLPDLQLSRDIMFGMPESVRELLVSLRDHCQFDLSSGFGRGTTTLPTVSAEWRPFGLQLLIIPA